MQKDTEFSATPYAQKIKWLAKDNEDIYDPDYGDMLRVAIMYSFSRGRLSDMVSLLSGGWFRVKGEIIIIGKMIGLYRIEGRDRMTLFINACVRKGSRTEKIADALLERLGGEVTELRLKDVDFPLVDADFLHRRDALIAAGSFDDAMFDMARQFAAADTVVIAAPFWDLSFPAMLKQYFEQINVTGITFRYTKEGFPEGLCNADRLYYVTTAGGMFFPEEYGFGYVRALAENFYGIRSCRLIKALGLDIWGADEEKILAECEKEIAELTENS